MHQPLPGSGWPHAGGAMADRVRALDWDATLLGPSAGWPPALRTMVEMVLDSPLVSSLAIGGGRVLVYNDAAAALYGDRHPTALGRPLAETFADSYGQVAALYDRVFAGESVTVAAQPLAVGAAGGDEVFDAYLTPVRDTDGTVIAAHMTGFEIGERLRADAALRESEAVRTVAIAGGRMGTWRWNLAARTVEGDAKFMALWGFPPTDAAMPLALFSDRMTPDGETQTQTVVTSAIAADEEFDAEIEVAAGPTAGRWLRWRGRAAPGDTSVLHGVSFDITEQKRAEAALRESEDQQAFLLALSDALRPVADPVAIQHIATRLLGELLGASRVFYVNVGDDGDTATIDANYVNGVPGRTGRYSLSAFSSYAVGEWRAGRTACSNDVDADPRYDAAERAAYASVSTRAGFGIPLLKDGRLEALLGVNQSTPRHWTDQEIELTRETAERTWAAVERARAEAALRESEKNYRTLFDSIDEGFAEIELITDRDGRVVDWRYVRLNPAFTRLTGMADVTGLLISEILPDLEPTWAARYTQMLETGEPVRFEEYAASVDMWLEVYAALIDGPDSRRAVLLYDNITARKRAEAEARESEARQAFMLRLSDTLRPLRDAAQIQQAAIDLLGEHLGVNRAGYYEVAEDQNTFFLTAGWERGLPPLPDRMLITDFGDEIREGYLAGRTMIASDTELDAATDDNLAAVRAIDVRAWIGVPLVKEGRWVAAMGVHSAVPRDWTPAELRLVEEVAERTWASAERARTEAALHESEAKYRTLFEGIDEGFCLCQRVPGEPLDYRYLATNPAFERQSGLSDPIGRTMRELVPGIEEWIMERYREVEESGCPARFESHVAELDRWFEIEVTPAERAGRIAILFRDITARRTAQAKLRDSEERQAFMLSLSDALRPLSDAAAMEEVAVRALGEQLGADQVFYASVAPDQGSWSVQYAYTTGAPIPAGSHAFSPFQRKRMAQWQAGRMSSVADSETDPTLSADDRASYAAFGARAAIGVPLVRGGRFAAMLVVNQATARQWTPAELALTREVAERTWIAIDRARVEAALRESEARQRMTVELVPVLLWSASPDGREVDLNERWMAYTGQSEAETQNYGWLKAIHADDLPEARAAFEHAFATGEPLEREQRIHKAGDGYRWHLVRHVPLRDDGGAIVRWFGAAVDIHDSKLAEQAVDESERWLQTLMQGVPQLVWRAVDGGHWTWASPQWTEFTAQSDADSHDFGWLDPVHPDDRERVREIWAGAVERGEFHADYRICDADQHRYKWFQTRATPVRDDEGRIIEWLGTSTDVDDIRMLQQRQQLLVAELQHRVRNVLTVVRSVFGRTVQAGGDVDEIADHFRGRLDALARTQVVMTQSLAGTVDLENLIRDELLSVGAHDGSQVTLEGPDVALKPKTAESIGLAIHELTTNAVKYGALSMRGASLSIIWKVNIGDDGIRRLVLTWTEQGVPAVALAPARYGFGRELIEEALPYRLGAETRLQFRGGGVCCSITLPLPDEGASAADTG